MRLTGGNALVHHGEQVLRLILPWLVELLYAVLVDLGNAFTLGSRRQRRVIGSDGLWLIGAFPSHDDVEEVVETIWGTASHFGVRVESSN